MKQSLFSQLRLSTLLSLPSSKRCQSLLLFKKRQLNSSQSQLHSKLYLKQSSFSQHPLNMLPSRPYMKQLQSLLSSKRRLQNSSMSLRHSKLYLKQSSFSLQQSSILLFLLSMRLTQKQSLFRKLAPSLFLSRQLSKQ